MHKRAAAHCAAVFLCKDNSLTLIFLIVYSFSYTITNIYNQVLQYSLEMK
ncbi:hypothetical protein HMPREF9555_01567 [Selenomonas artemidis F0399]|uniref:Uncharacterized protein n=1 Tax=Selenomonas artemidis F0399 TaxID=749551 RepID=E7N3H7_9FIRM|nr:hypothetical protein HMPREF9555_01567 [Selenomonas artemidis F0399]